MKKLNWWDEPQNKITVDFPISLVKDGKMYVACTNKDTDRYLGKFLGGVAQGTTEKESIEKLFDVIKIHIEHYKCESLSYQRWVPFRKGDWSHRGGRWFVVFGFQFYFRIGKNMKGGSYVPFTKLNILFSSEWKEYREFKKKYNED